MYLKIKSKRIFITEDPFFVDKKGRFNGHSEKTGNSCIKLNKDERLLLKNIIVHLIAL